jgi:hypothetical protein
MHVTLFHADNDQFFDCAYLRQRAAEMAKGTPLIRDAGSGDKTAATALKIGFWPFVREFERAIGQRALPREPLMQKFGGPRVRNVFAGIARSVREMKEQEGSHAAIWRDDAEGLGLRALDEQATARVRDLIESAYTCDLSRFFAVLAATEFVAEELSRFLVGAPDFIELFARKRWAWGEVHLAPHEAGPSHLEIDLDLARAYSPTTDAAEIERMVIETCELFEAAAREVAKTPLHSF